MAGRHRDVQPGSWVLTGATVAIALILAALVLLVIIRAAPPVDTDTGVRPTPAVTSWPPGSTPTGPAPTPPPQPLEGG